VVVALIAHVTGKAVTGKAVTGKAVTGKAVAIAAMNGYTGVYLWRSGFACFFVEQLSVEKGDECTSRVGVR
jgi:hypothetical protein